MPPPPARFADAMILTGPTGSGKTALALDLAGRLNAEVVSADSMTFYRQMDIGTAKPTPEERARVPHHLIDVIEPWESVSVAWWLGEAAAACDAIRARGRRPLFVGGTPFYLKALTCGLFESPPADAALRASLEAEARDAGNVALHDRLREVDPRAATRLHPNDVQRVVRALEIHRLTGRPISDLQQTWGGTGFAREGQEPPRPAVLPCVVLEWPRATLCERIDARVNGMLAAGWAEEVRHLDALPKPPGPGAAQALGYRELRAVNRGERDLAGALPEIQLRTRQFAKRQMTSFRTLPGTTFVAANSASLASRVVEVLLGVRPPGEV